MRRRGQSHAGAGRSDERDRLTAGAFLLTASAWAIGVVWLRSHRHIGYPSNDIYAYFYPNVLHVEQSLRHGAGLLWNPYQDCGQPFFGVSQTGLLYPLNAVFLLLPREPALIASLAVHLFIAGAAFYVLCRELSLEPFAALSGALVFQLAGTAVQLGSWNPTIIATYAWMPVALWSTERLLKRPTARGAICLGSILTVQLLPGYPQILFFTVQLIALRVAWAIVARQTPRPAALAMASAVAVVLPILLAAVQFLPSLEVLRQSVRWGALAPAQLGGEFTWVTLRRAVADVVDCQGAVVLVLAAVPGVFALRRGRLRGTGVFYLTAAALYFALSLGPGTPLFDLYAKLPLGSAFRAAGRLAWATNFCWAVVAAVGAQAVARTAPAARRWAVSGVVLAGAGLLQMLNAKGLGGGQWVLAGLVVLAAATASRPCLSDATRLGMPLVILCNALLLGCPPFFDLRSGDVYSGSEPAIDFVRERMTPQDRVAIVSQGLSNYSLMPKTATLARLPAIFDYEPQVARSYAEFFTYLRTGQPMKRLKDWYWVFDQVMPRTVQRPLLDLTAARYLIVARAVDATPAGLGPDVRLLDETADTRVYENPRALPRAFYVPRAEVVAPDAVLPALASGAVNPRATALITEAPRSGFLGADAAATGDVEFAANEADRVVLRVRAGARGFLFLADEYFPGWRVRVDGREEEILRANHTFRLVEVPQGESEVVFLYRPASLRIGVAVSFLSLAAVIAVWRRGGKARGAR